MINQLFDQFQDVKNMQLADSNRDIHNFANLEERVKKLEHDGLSNVKYHHVNFTGLEDRLKKLEQNWQL